MLVECLPQEIYQKLAKIWDLDPDLRPQFPGYPCQFTPEQIAAEDELLNEYLKNVERDLGFCTEFSEDIHVSVGSKSV